MSVDQAGDVDEAEAREGLGILQVLALHLTGPSFSLVNVGALWCSRYWMLTSALMVISYQS